MEPLEIGAFRMMLTTDMPSHLFEPLPGVAARRHQCYYGLSEGSPKHRALARLGVELTFRASKNLFTLTFRALGRNHIVLKSITGLHNALFQLDSRISQFMPVLKLLIISNHIGMNRNSQQCPQAQLRSSSGRARSPSSHFCCQADWINLQSHSFSQSYRTI